MGNAVLFETSRSAGGINGYLRWQGLKRIVAELKISVLDFCCKTVAQITPSHK